MNETESNSGIRLNKYLASSGVCTRREASTKIKAGQVQVNGETITFPGHVVSETDEVYLHGKIIKPLLSFTYILVNKPKNTLSTTQEVPQEKTIAKVFGGKVHVELEPIDVLGKQDTGLIVFTNDSEIIEKFKKPDHKGNMILHVFLDKPLEEKDIKRIIKGVKIEDELIRVGFIRHIKAKEQNELDIELKVGRMNDLGRIFKHLGYGITKIDRIFFAGLNKKDLPRDRFRHLTRQEVIMLKHFT